ncbi:nucleoside recognition membrane protein YjiH [Cytobacillus oceanisediminis]|jgi:nucleoside recognition membrane protein YjiH|uniref:Nucleoside recognition membrane protein YjiH n=1 Tax=Cytobacillus oceanisediminis TaxID=665099 RepID=A0A2V2ZD20_9BACI|nr:YjiH family protein [Cytobacillus oceanisediminis]PWW17434.1 nucleoside recognition membrane protein YjiH [Cytobacillus oceanisediminis]
MSSLSKKMPESEQVQLKAFTSGDYLKFLIPSLVGILLFMVPISEGEGITIPVAFLAGKIGALLGDSVYPVTVIVISLSVIGSFIAKVFKPGFILNSPFLNKLFNVSKFWLAARFLGMVFAIITLFKLGFEPIYSENTGGLLIYDLIPILFTTFLLAGLLLPLLLNFGLLEFFGALLIKVMRPIFTLPGRSSLDCLASWVGDGTIGVLLTTKQYEDGYYTKREAAVVATTFSVVSITFTIVIIQYLNLEHYFLHYYFTIILAGLAAAIIMPRIPPLSRKANTGYEGTELKEETSIPANVSPVNWGINNAVKKAQTNKSASAVIKEGFQNVLDMWLGVLPIVMAIGTVALVIAEYTPAFMILGKPFEPILALMQIPEAGEAAQTMVVGFADMFLPAVIGSGIESEMTRFVIACVSVTQLVYMSEMGGLLLGSKLPVSIKDLILIFLLRTIITLPIVVVIAHIIF